MQLSITTDFLFRHPGNAARRLAEIDWSNTPLGPMALWSPALRVSVQMMLASSFPKALVWGPEMITLHNDAFKPILGDKPCAQGRPFPDVWAEAWSEIAPIAEKARNGEATYIENFPLTIERYGYPEACNFTFCYSPIHSEHGEVEGFIDTVIETSETVRAQRNLQVMNAELSHRLKNTYTLVAAITRQTMLSSRDADSGMQALSRRLGALADAHEVLMLNGGRGAPLRDVITRTLQPHFGDTGMLALNGPNVTLTDRESLALSLALNELATNALKYGSAASGGKIRIDWALEDDKFGFQWTEDCVDAPPETERKGFGRRLLETIVPMDFDGTSAFEHVPGSLRYVLTGRLTS